MENIIEIKNLTKQYGKLKALDNLSVNIPQGSVYGILGPNGSGKSTLLSIILGIIKAQSGNFTWANSTPNNPNNMFIGALIEQPNFYPYLSAKENLRIIAQIKDFNGDFEKEVERVLSKVGLYERIDSKFSTYSYGMKTRLALASVLLGDPQTIILDEPTNGLDPAGINFVRNLIIDEAKKNKTIILASHILNEVEKICTDVLILQYGELIASGKVQDVLQDVTYAYIKSNDNNKLLQLIKNEELIANIDDVENLIKVELEEEKTVNKISEIAVKNNILITRLEIKKKSLETEFLERTKK